MHIAQFHVIYNKYIIYDMVYIHGGVYIYIYIYIYIMEGCKQFGAIVYVPPLSLKCILDCKFFGFSYDVIACFLFSSLLKLFFSK